MKSTPTLVAILISSAALLSCDPRRTFTVSTTADSGENSLRGVMSAAHQDGAQGGDATIELPSGTYELTVCGADDTNAAGDLDWLSGASLTLLATGADVVIRQTCPNERVLDQHTSGRLTLIGVTLTGGNIVGDDTPESSRGGALRALGDVKLDRALITSSSVTGFLAKGGGLYVAGSLSARDSVISLNRAQGALQALSEPSSAEGGGAYVVGGVTFTGGSLEQNQARGSDFGGSARGGGLAQESGSTEPVLLTDTALYSNTAQGGNVPTSGRGGDARGGALAIGGYLSAVRVAALVNSARGGVSSANGSTFPPPIVVVAGGAALGGAILTSGAVSCVDCLFANNTATTASVAARSVVLNSGPFPTPLPPCWRTMAPLNPGMANGGALWVGLSTHLERSSFESNGTFAEGQTVSYCQGTSCVLIRDTCPDSTYLSMSSSGGAVLSGGDLDVTGGAFAQNRMVLNGGNYNGTALSGSSDARISGVSVIENMGAGAIAIGGRLQISGSRLIGNSGGVGADTVEANAVTVAQSGFTGIGGRVVSLTNTTVTGSGAHGVAAETLSLEHCTIADNQTELGFVQLSAARSLVLAREGAAICPEGSTLESS
ncbi:MAG TPA: hypothetical protein VK524_24725, partial [Polyangiaceae bacterium]|nr:hypothetical protein [Polyangiaceae bacterium]